MYEAIAQYTGAPLSTRLLAMLLHVATVVISNLVLSMVLLTVCVVNHFQLHQRQLNAIYYQQRP